MRRTPLGLRCGEYRGATLISADLQESTLSESRLCGADLRAADLRGARLSNTNLTGANLTRANLEKADLKQSDVSGAIFDLADLREVRLMGIKHFAQARWIGADIRGMDLRGAYVIRRHIADENYLYEFRSRSPLHRWLYRLWWLTSDCGRSLSRWTAWLVGVALLFAVLYSFVLLDEEDMSGPSLFYYSVVTLTTLGYGDIVPVSGAARMLAATEAVVGYVGWAAC